MTSTLTKYTESDRLAQVAEINRLWEVACDHQGVDPSRDSSLFKVLPQSNPYAAEHQAAMDKLKVIAADVYQD